MYLTIYERYVSVKLNVWQMLFQVQERKLTFLKSRRQESSCKMKSLYYANNSPLIFWFVRDDCNKVNF